MPDIHNTVLTDDKTFNSLKAVIEEFDRQCTDYMNEITDEAPPLLKKGTNAYNQKIEYKKKHPTLNQSYQKVDVINARQGGVYYYVWVTEVMNINENGAAKYKRLEMTKGLIREKVLKCMSIDELNHIFDTDGFFDE